MPHLRKGKVIKPRLVEFTDGLPSPPDGTPVRIYLRAQAQTIQEYAHEIAEDLRQDGKNVSDEEILAELQ